MLTLGFIRFVTWLLWVEQVRASVLTPKISSYQVRAHQGMCANNSGYFLDGLLEEYSCVALVHLRLRAAVKHGGEYKLIYSTACSACKIGSDTLNIFNKEYLNTTHSEKYAKNTIRCRHVWTAIFFP